MSIRSRIGRFFGGGPAIQYLPRDNSDLIGAASSITLVESEIVEEIRRGRLIKNKNDTFGKVRSCSYDLTVGTIFWEGKVTRRDGGSKQVVVPPGGVVGIFTAEELLIPPDMFATVFAINAMSSKGFLVLNPGHVDPGFEGPLTVKALNVRKTSIAISQDDPIFTILFQRIGFAAPHFKGNKSVADREREFHAETVQSSPDTLAQVITIDPNGPFPTKDQVREMVRSDAINRTMLVLSAVAAFAAMAALLVAVAPSTFQRNELTREEARRSVDFTAVPVESPLPALEKNSAEQEIKVESKKD